MREQSFTNSIEVEQCADDVFKCLGHVSNWWTKDFTGSSAQLGDEFIINHPGAHYSKQKVVEFVPGKKLVWLVTESKLSWLTTNQHEWTNTKMIFEIETSGKKTILHFTHLGLTSEKECYEKCNQGWTKVITDWLFNYITTGKQI